MRMHDKLSMKKIYILFFLIVIINIVISLCLNPVENSLIADDLLTIDSLNSGNGDCVYSEEHQAVFKESVETCVAYAYIDISDYDYLLIEMDAYPTKDQCRIYVDISGDNSKWDTVDGFYSQFYLDTDADHTYVNGRLEIGRNHTESGVFRIMNDAGAPVIVRNLHVSGWKFYKLSNYSIFMFMILSVMLLCMMQKVINNHCHILSCFIESAVAFASVNVLAGGILNDAVRASDSLREITTILFKYWVGLSQYTWIVTAFFVLYFYIVFHFRRVDLHNYSIVSSYVFSCFILSGYMYHTNNVFFELYHQKYFWMEFLIILIGLALFIQCVMKVLHIFMKNMANSKAYQLPRKKCFLIVWIIITVVWLPHLIIRYPAAIHWDSAVQISRVLNDSIRSTLFWPIVSTLLMGEAVKLGNLVFGSYDMGIFLYVLMQSVICSAIFAYGISLLTEFRASRLYIWTATFICSCMPVFSSFTTSVSKDVPFSNLVMLFLIMIFEVLIIKSKISLRYNFFFGCVIVSTILLSNKGIFYVLVSIIGIVIFWIIKKENKYWKIVACLMISLLLAQAVQTTLKNIYGSTSRLNVTVCQVLQGIGYYAIKYEEELSIEDKELLDSFVIYENIADSYRMDMADGIFIDIWRTENEHSINDIWGLTLLWCKAFFKHPDCVMDATFRCNYGFFYPDVKQWGNYNSGYYIGDPNVPNIKLPFKYPELLKHLNIKFSNFIMLIENLPVMYLLNSIAISVWIQIFICIYLFFQKKWEEWFCVLVSLVSFALCLIGPTYYCGGARYALVSVFFNIFLVGYWINDRYKENGQ